MMKDRKLTALTENLIMVVDLATVRKRYHKETIKNAKREAFERLLQVLNESTTVRDFYFDLSIEIYSVLIVEIKRAKMFHDYTLEEIIECIKNAEEICKGWN